MQLHILERKNQKFAEIISDSVVIRDIRDALDLMADANYHEAAGTILREKHLPPTFFDLRSGLAGEIVQKCATYQMKLAIIGEFEKFQSDSLKAFIIESNRGRLIFFVSDLETAIAKLVAI